MAKRRKAIRRRSIRLHVFVPSGSTTWNGERICGRDDCGSVETASVHNVPERSDEERAIEARKVGERGDQAD